jgi:NTE family protein
MISLKSPHNYGAEIHSIIRIIRDRLESPNVSKNADFSPTTIKRLILEGERKTTESFKTIQTKTQRRITIAAPVHRII